MQIPDGQRIISMIIVHPKEGAILTATELGFGKRTQLEEYRVQGRGGQGIISIQTLERNGNVIGAVQIADKSQIMLITDGGTLVRTPVKDVSMIGRNTQGVKLINLTNNEKLVGLERILDDGDNDDVDTDHLMNAAKLGTGINF